VHAARGEKGIEGRACMHKVRRVGRKRGSAWNRATGDTINKKENALLSSAASVPQSEGLAYFMTLRVSPQGYM
jgi:hypothetical protein